MTIKIDVDMTKCQHYGQCVFEAPDIFRLNSDDKHEYTAAVEEMNPGNIEAAIDICPMQAMRIVE